VAVIADRVRALTGAATVDRVRAVIAAETVAIAVTAAAVSMAPPKSISISS
jgi:hypothetical protein